MIKPSLGMLLGIIAVLCSASLPAETYQSLEVKRLDGSTLLIANFREHRATAILFLSSRSSESVAAADSIRKLNDRYRRRKVMFVGVFPSAAESGEEIRDFCQASGFVFPCYRDPQQKAARRLEAHVTPEAFVLDNTGAVIYTGSVSGLEAAVADIASDAKVRVAVVPPNGTPIDHPAPARKIESPYGSISYSSELIFEKIPGAPAHHASSMTLASNGDLLVSWYGGSYESSDDEALYLARRRKGSRAWDQPVMLLRNPEQPVGNAVIFTMKTGDVWIVWGRMEASQPMLAHTGWDATRLMFRVSRDHGHTWSADRPFPMETAGWLPRNLAIRLADGSTMVPVSDERNNRDLSFFLMTKDSGATWTRSLDIPNQQSQGEQPAVAQRRDGSLIAFLRTSPRLLQAESFDGGKTWTAAKVTDFKNPDAAISICALRNGNLLLVWNNNERGRSPLHIARSTDDGKSWSQPLLLEANPGEYSYPSIMQTPDDKIHVIYTYRRYSFMHLEFNEEWLTHAERPD
jgi:predicted neuraminidase